MSQLMPSKVLLFMMLSWLGLVSSAQGAVPAAPDVGLLDLDWRVYVAAKPVYCILVEKDRQRLRVLRHDGRLRVVAEYAAASGENPGSKEREGDARTPEGIYLITKGYLDRKLSVFGNRAYQLNYPNWYDLGAGRGGNGIYLHGTNRPLQPNSSNGCVTLQNSDLEQLADYLTVGTPVFIVPTLKPPAVVEGEEGYPDLTGADFAGARALLLPEGGGAAAFASLYLIRVKGQTLVAGEYWATPESSAPRPAVAYLHQEEDNRWAVVDRGTGAAGQEKEETVTVAGLPAELWREVAGGGTAEWSLVEPVLWEPGPDSITLEWFREANAQPPAAVPAPTPPPVAAVPAGVRPEVIYALFGLATCLSIGSALFLLRRQGAGVGEGVGPGAEGEVPIARVRDEVKEAMDALRTVQARIDKEARQVESQEALKERVEGLEEAFAERETAIVRLSAEQAALKEEEARGRADLADELGRLHSELTAMRGDIESARLEMAAGAELAGMVNEQLIAVRRLTAEREEPMVNGEAMQRVVTATCDLLREQVRAMLETLPRSAAPPHSEAGGASSGSDEVMAELRAFALAMRAAQAEMATLRGETADSGAVTAALEGLRLELREAGEESRRQALSVKEEAGSRLAALGEELRAAQGEKAELMGRLERLSELAATVAERDRELLALREEGEMSRRRALSEKSEVESRLAALGAELLKEQAAKTELAARLARLGELESAVAERTRELQAVRESGEAAERRALSEKSELESRLAALSAELLKEQTDKTELAGRLARLGELEAAVAERECELQAVRESGEAAERRALSEKSELESRLAALSAELLKEQTDKKELAGRLARLGELEAAVVERECELQAMREAGEAAERRALSAKGEVESRLAALGAELLKEQEDKTELAGRLARLGELEATVAEQGREIEALREANELVTVSSTTERSRLEATIAELVLARQVEVTTLTAVVQEAKEKSAGEQEAMAALRHEVERSQEALRQALAREQAAEQLTREQGREVENLGQEIAGFKARVAELEQKAAAGEGVVLIKGAHYLPGDVLRKWIGREQ